MIIVTLDTSCLNPNHPELDELAKLSLDGKITLYFEIPSEVETDKWKEWRGEEKKRKMLWWKNLYTKQHDIVFKKGETPPLTDPKYDKIFKKVKEIHSPLLGVTYNFEDLSERNQKRVWVDWKLCAEHIYYGGDYFVTKNKTEFIDDGRKEKFETTFPTKIRLLNKDFIDELKEIARDNMKFEIKELVRDKADREFYHEEEDQLCLNGDVIGYCVKIDREPFEIIDIKITKEKLREKGYGTIFVKKYEVMAKERKCTKMMARVEESNMRGINFWKNHANWVKGEKNDKGQWIFYKNL